MLTESAVDMFLLDLCFSAHVRFVSFCYELFMITSYSRLGNSISMQRRWAKLLRLLHHLLIHQSLCYHFHLLLSLPCLSPIALQTHQ